MNNTVTTLRPQPNAPELEQRAPLTVPAIPEGTYPNDDQAVQAARVLFDGAWIRGFDTRLDSDDYYGVGGHTSVAALRTRYTIQLQIETGDGHSARRIAQALQTVADR